MNKRLRIVRPQSFALLICLLILTGVMSKEVTTQTPDRGVRVANQVKTLPGSAKRYALIIGVDQYADTQITTLGGASNDAKTLANALIQYAGFPGEQVTLLASDQPAERQPTRGNILRRLSNMAAVIPPDGLLLISFAGHGIERSGQAFLLPADSQVSNDVDLLEQDRKSTRLNSSHANISYAVFCLKKNKIEYTLHQSLIPTTDT